MPYFFERRKILYHIEVRELHENKLVCLVNNYDWSKLLTDKHGKKFKERISKEVWQKAISKNPIKIFLNHSDYVEIGSDIQIEATENGVLLSLTLSEKEQGIYFAAKENRLTGCSFGFKCIDEKITECGDFYEREILNFELYEISILDKIPAYNNTSVEARNLQFNRNQLLIRKLHLLALES